MKSRVALLICHLLGNALLLWLGYWWLGFDESNNRRLLGSAAVIIAFIAGTAWLHGMALAHFSGLPLRRAAARGVANLPALFALGLFTIALYGGLIWLGYHFVGAAYTLGSASTLQFKRPVSPRAVERFFSIALLIVQWVAAPVLLLPLARSIAVDGWRGWQLRSLRRSRRVMYWIEVAALLFIGLWLPFRLFFWTPKIDSFGGQFWSLAGRMAAGYLLFVVALLLIEFFTSAGKPRETQPSTVVSP